MKKRSNAFKIMGGKIEMDFSEKWGTTVEEAVNLALTDLKLTREEVEVKVLEEPSKGFFGIGSKLALVRVEKKKPVKETVKKEEPVVVQVSDSFKESARPVVAKKEKPAILETSSVKEEKPVSEEDIKWAERVPGSDRSFRSRGAKGERGKPGRSERPQRERVKFSESSEPVEKEFVFTGESVTPARPDDLQPCDDHQAVIFLKDLTEKMGLNVEIEAKKNDAILYVDMSGSDSGTVIGKRGQTLDAIQYLTSLVVNKEEGQYIRVVVDAEDYRGKRERTLEALACRLADKVVKTRRSVRLEPMNPYERKVIHSTLQGNTSVLTRSEGEEPYRRVVIDLKR